MCVKVSFQRRGAGHGVSDHRIGSMNMYNVGRYSYPTFFIRHRTVVSCKALRLALQIQFVDLIELKNKDYGNRSFLDG